MNELVIENRDEPVIQFLHANAYTPGCYRQFCTHLGIGKILLPSQRPLWENSSPDSFHSWHILANDIIRHMDEKGRTNIIGIGHSMGGVASWLAAIKRPDLFKQLILIDPVILPIKAVRTLHLLPMSLKKKYFPMVKIASRRRDQWDSKEDAGSYFLSKKVFQRFEPGVLEDFLNDGLIKTGSGVRLAYPGSWEAQVYATPPNMWKYMKKNPCPITIIRAEYSDVINEERWSRIKSKMAHATFIQMDGARHLIPFEDPERCAAVVREAIL